jgi:bacteriocin-like protein
MKKLSKNEMKSVMGGFYPPPLSGCYGEFVVCQYPYPSVDQACCGGLSCRPYRDRPGATKVCQVDLVP